MDAIIREVEERSVPAVPFSLVCSLSACVELLPDLVTLPGPVVNDLLVGRLRAVEAVCGCTVILKTNAPLWWNINPVVGPWKQRRFSHLPCRTKA